MFNAIRSRKGQNRWMREEEKRFRNKTKGRWKVTWKAGIDFIHREIEEVNLDWISSAAPQSDDKRRVLPIGPPAVAQKKSSSSKTPKSGLLCGGSRLAWPLQRVRAAWSATVISLHVASALSLFTAARSLLPLEAWILRHRKSYCAVILHDSAFISLNMSAAVVSNNTETFFWGTDANHAGQRPQRYPGLVQMAVGYKASQWASQVPAGPVLTAHLWPDLITGWHLGVAAVWAKSALCIETNYVGFLYIYILYPVGAKSVSPWTDVQLNHLYELYFLICPKSRRKSH